MHGVIHSFSLLLLAWLGGGESIGLSIAQLMRLILLGAARSSRMWLRLWACMLSKAHQCPLFSIGTGYRS